MLLLSPSAVLVSPQDVKSAGIVQSDLPGAIPEKAMANVPKGELVEFTYDSFQESDGAMSPFTTTLPDTSHDWNSEDEDVAGAGGCHGKKSPGENASSEEEGEAGDKSCEMTWKKSQRLADGLMRFSIDLLREVQLESDRANVMLSPLSIALALSQLALGNSEWQNHHSLPFPLPEARATSVQDANEIQPLPLILALAALIRHDYN